MSKYFPIKTETACQLKWNWSTLYLYSGTTASCHRTAYSAISAESFDNFHNTEKKQQHRLSMLKGQWPQDGCGYCKDLEDAGEFSDRLLHLTIPDQSPVELDTDPAALVVDPTILEVYFNNTCNLSCLYCSPTLSSKINSENKKFGKFESNGIKISAVDKNADHAIMIDKFWQWMQQHSTKLKRLNILGGEPLYQTEFYHCLDYLENSKHPDLVLNIVTNLMISNDKLTELIERFKLLLAKRKIKRLDITCSIDCWGKEQEFVRHGLDLALWERNFELLLKQKWITLNINQTITMLTIKTMPALLEKLSSWRTQHKIGHYFSVATPEPAYLVPAVLGSGVFDNDFEKIIQLMPSDTEQDLSARQYMTVIAEQVKQSQIDCVELKKCVTYLDEMDRRRNTNWRTLFPWLTEFEQYVV